MDGPAHVLWRRQPELREPILVAAFEGWNDAGDAATMALQFLRDRWEAKPFAAIDPEEFYDFTTTRPRVELDEDEQRHIVWPANELSAALLPDARRDGVFLLGVEPQLRWRTFSQQVVGVAERLGVRMVLTLGALLAEVAHSRPTSVVSTGYDPDLVADLDLQPSGYEGPTGIVGVLHQELRAADIASASLWAAVPTYVPAAPSPKATLALVERASTMLGSSLPTTELEIATASYERQVNELVAEDDETADYVRQLEDRFDAQGGDLTDGPSLVDEVERFLRDQD